MESGERKSPTADALFQPLYDYEISQQEEFKKAQNSEQNERIIKGNRLKALQTEAAKTKDRVKAQLARQEADELFNELAMKPEQFLPVYTCTDVTTEKLAVLMSENNEQMNILCAEGGIFDILAGRYSDGQANFDLYLQAYSHEPVSIHRINRQSITLRNPSLTMCLGVQPDVIEEIGKYKRFRGRGFLARFLYVKCKPKAGNRPRRTNKADQEIISRYNEHIKKLISIQFTESVIVYLSQQAQVIWDGFYNDIDKEMDSSGELYDLKDWGNKLPGTVARLAGLFHFSQYGSDVGKHAISANIVSASCLLGSYFLKHAKTIFRIMSEPENIKTAKMILEYIKRVRPESFKGREVIRHTNLKTMGEVSPGLDLLCQRSFIQPVDTTTYKGQGRPESTTYIVNPKILNS